MTNFEEKVKSLKNLKYLFLGSLIISALTLLLMVITTSLQTAGLLNNNPNAQALVVADKIVLALRFLVFVAAAIVAILAYKLSKQNKIAAYIMSASAVMFIIVFILELTVSVQYLNEIMCIVACLLYTCGIYLFFQGVLLEDKDNKVRGPFHKMVVLALCLILVGQILSFIGTTFRFTSGFNLALIYIATTLALVGNLILLFCTSQIISKCEIVQQELKGETK